MTLAVTYRFSCDHTDCDEMSHRSRDLGKLKDRLADLGWKKVLYTDGDIFYCPAHATEHWSKEILLPINDDSSHGYNL